jgi:hypothetical protein
MTELGEEGERRRVASSGLTRSVEIEFIPFSDRFQKAVLEAKSVTSKPEKAVYP